MIPTSDEDLIMGEAVHLSVNSEVVVDRAHDIALGKVRLHLA